MLLVKRQLYERQSEKGAAAAISRQDIYNDVVAFHVETNERLEQYILVELWVDHTFLARSVSVD